MPNFTFTSRKLTNQHVIGMFLSGKEILYGKWKVSFNLSSTSRHKKNPLILAIT